MPTQLESPKVDDKRNNMEADQDTTKVLHKVIDQEMIRPASTKHKQGLLFRLRGGYFLLSARIVGDKGGRLRLIPGIAPTHTRDLYL
jgi:hypothetical protein